MRKWLARLALVLLVLAAELTGRSLTHRIDLGRHVARVREIFRELTPAGPGVGGDSPSPLPDIAVVLFSGHVPN